MKLREAQVAGITALLACAGSAMADGTIRFDSVGEGFRHWGGVFNMTIVDDSASHGYDNSSWDAYVGSLGGGYQTDRWVGTSIENGIGSSFKTFCIETAVDLGHPGGYFLGDTSTSADSGRAYGDWGGTDHTALEKQTAYLYSSYRSNSLGGVAGWSSADAATQANALQGAIWLFQNQVSEDFVNSDVNDSTSGDRYSEAEQALIAALVADANLNSNTAYWEALGNVRVLNLLWGAHPGTDGDVECQSVLVLTGTTIPLPTSAAMAFAGVLGIAGVRRRRN